MSHTSNAVAALIALAEACEAELDDPCMETEEATGEALDAARQALRAGGFTKEEKRLIEDVEEREEPARAIRRLARDMI